jgi:biotin synthase
MDRAQVRHGLTALPLAELRSWANAVRAAVKGEGVFLRGIVEFSNHCVRNCLYCGLRSGNRAVRRYRMEPREVVAAAVEVARAGVGSVVLQSGDDLDYPAGDIARIIVEIKARCEVAVVLSAGERPFSDYDLWREAGAQRYLIKHETADPELYARLHPGRTLSQRLAAQRHLKSLGYEVGSGFIVGLPGQDADTLARDILLVRETGADMCGAGPFIPQADTPLAGHPPGSEETSLRVLSLLRLICPEVNIPATTALATLDPENGQSLALLHGANVIMPSFTPPERRENYRIYDHKAQVDLENAREAASRAGRRIIRDGRVR